MKRPGRPAQSDRGQYTRQLQCELAEAAREIEALHRFNLWMAMRIKELEHGSNREAVEQEASR
jgi:hypothetical protein